MEEKNPIPADDFKKICENLSQRNRALRKVMNIPNGATVAPGFRERCAMEDNTRLPINEEYFVQLFPEYNAFAEAVRQKIAAMPEVDKGIPVSKENLWIWGGPHPEWGGSLKKDTLMQNVKYFNAENGIYVYGPVSEEMIALHSGLKKMLVMVTNTCRAPGQQPESDAECAEKLSRLSLKYPNITGGMMDDMTASLTTITAEKIQQVKTVSENLKKHNPALELYGTVYSHELEEKDFDEINPYIDGVNLWFWYQEVLLDLEARVELCRKKFHGKKILLGLFIHDYGTADAGTVPDLLLHQLKVSRKLLAENKITGLVILGDREILKWPEQAGLIKGFLAAQN